MRTTYIGMDIHKNFIQAVAMDKHGNILKEQKYNQYQDDVFIHFVIPPHIKLLYL
ncbi:MAG: hypothetical protein KAV40_03050 [Thermoplasmatales archaeon]|nr:hypothetical protein [Thermoplasmatales archaeon]